ncbi:MAG: hypothetical protein IKI68_05030 [Clostridia bacterium]|nr:hypothetical protein [Clostridia bacterium]
MQKSLMSFVKGMGAGMIAGAGVTLIGKSMIGNKNSISKGSAKVVKAAGEFIDGIQTMFK